MRFHSAGLVSETRHSAPASLGLLALAILAFSGCYLPPFDEKLSESEQFAAELSPVVRLGPVGMGDWMYEGGYFLPSRGSTTPADGFWVRQSGSDLVAAHMTASSIHQSSHTSDNELGAGFVAFPLTELQISGLSLSSPQRGIFTIFGSDELIDMPALATDAGFGLSYSLFPIDVSPEPTDSIVGASYRISDSTLDRVSVLYQSSAEPPVFSGGWMIAASDAAWTASSVLLSTSSDSSGIVPALKPGAFFGQCASNLRQYVSGYRKDNSALYAAYWPNFLSSSPVALSGIAARISAILSTDRLLAVGDGIMYLYDLDGALVASYATGSMRFAYEYYGSDGVWYCYFTRAVRVKDDGSDGKVIVDLYRCRSDSLDSLGN